MTTPAPLTGVCFQRLIPEQLARLQVRRPGCSPNSLLGLRLFLRGVLNPRSGAVAVTPAPEGRCRGLRLSPLRKPARARRVAEALRDDLLAANLNVTLTLVNAGDYISKQIASEKLLVIVTSREEKAEPPGRASRCINSCSPKSAETGKHRFCRVLASATPLIIFCQSGKDFDGSWRNWAVGERHFDVSVATR